MKIKTTAAAILILLYLWLCMGSYYMDKASAAINRSMQVFSDYGRTFLIKEDSSLWAWGDNELGLLGDGTRDNRLKRVKIMEDVLTVEIGYYNTLVIKNDNSLWIWGKKDYANSEIYDVEDNDLNLKPIKILDNVKAVSAGRSSIFALKKDGSLWSWGENIRGVLGNGTYEDQFSPAKIIDGVRDMVAAVDCTSAYAIKKDDSLWAWGENISGQLGDGTRVNRNLPVKIMDGVASTDGTAALKKDGTLWTWRLNDYYSSQDVFPGSISPVNMMDNVKSFSTNESHFFAVKKDGTLWSWGDNTSGVLGDGAKEDRAVPVKVTDQVASIYATFADTAFALKTDGSLWGWGSNYSGEVDGRAGEEIHTPVKIMDNVSWSRPPYSYTKDGSLWAWGSNYGGQLGTGGISNTVKPLKIFDACAIVSCNLTGATIGEDTVTAMATSDISKMTIGIETESDTQWKLFSDKECQHELADKTLNLNTGINVTYIKVMANSSSISKLYELKINKNSDDCAITSVPAPGNAQINGNTITADVDYSLAEMDADFSISLLADWRIFTDQNCTMAIADQHLILNVGENIFYVKVFSADGKSNRVYTYTINRAHPSQACEMLAIGQPENAMLKGDTVFAQVSSITKSVNVELTVSERAKWALYSDAACKNELVDKKIAITKSANHAYAKITAEDGVTTKIYPFIIKKYNNTFYSLVALFVFILLGGGLIWLKLKKPAKPDQSKEKVPPQVASYQQDKPAKYCDNCGFLLKNEDQICPICDKTV